MRQAIIAIITVGAITQSACHSKEPEPVLRAAPPAPIETPDDEACTEPSSIETCFEGYTLRESGKKKSCYKSVVEPARQVCANVSDVGCKVVTPYLTQCPKGFVPFDGGLSCAKAWEVPMQFYCPKGFIDENSSCVKREDSEMVPQCDVGQLVGETCLSLNRKPYIINSKCPEGSNAEEDGNCWAVIEEFECGTVKSEPRVVSEPPTPSPELGKSVFVTKKEGHGHHTHMRHLEKIKEDKSKGCDAKMVTEKVEPGCSKEMVSVSAPHSTKVSIEKKLCSKKLQVDAIAIKSCPQGFVDNGEHCIEENVTPARMICLSTGLSTGNCPPVTQWQPKRPGCPKGAVMGKDGKCFDNEIVSPAKICAKGYKDDGTTCVGSVKSPGYECTPGLHLNKLNNTCTGELVREPIRLLIEPDHMVSACNKVKY